MNTVIKTHLIINIIIGKTKRKRKNKTNNLQTDKRLRPLSNGSKGALKNETDATDATDAADAAGPQRSFEQTIFFDHLLNNI